MTDLLTADKAHIARLEDRVRLLEREIVEKDRAIADERRLVEVGVKNLRRQLSPLYKALQQVFGELDALGGDASADVAVTMNQPSSDYWQTWKLRMTASVGKVIDVLIATPHLNNSQIAAAARMNHGTVSNSLGALRKAGILATNGGKHSLQIPGGGA